MSKKIDQHILDKYKVGSLIGSGAYGHVWKAVDKITHKQYALKKVFGAFRNNIDAQRTYRQVEVLQKINHPNIIKLHKILGANNKEDLYLVFELMEADLLAVVGTNTLKSSHHKYVLFQILKAIAHLHQLKLIHRDLKPSNILLDSDCHVKICDFGLVRSLAIAEQEHPILSQEVATRWYRAPQLLLGSRSYSYPADLWSVGCIAAQLLIGKPLFQGNSVLQQLQKIISYTGQLSKQDLQSIDSPVVECLVSQIHPKAKTFSDYFSLVSPQFYPLIKGLLKFNPQTRLTAKQALNLQLFYQFQSQSNYHEDLSIKAIIPQLDDNKRFNLRDYRKQIYSSIPKELRAPSDKKESTQPAIFKNETVKNLTRNKKFSKTVEVLPKKDQSTKKRNFSKASEKPLQQKRLSQGSLSTKPIHLSPSAVIQRNLSPYKKQLQLQLKQKDSPYLAHNPIKKLPQLKKNVRKDKKDCKFKK